MWTWCLVDSSSFAHHMDNNIIRVALGPNSSLYTLISIVHALSETSLMAETFYRGPYRVFSTDLTTQVVCIV